MTSYSDFSNLLNAYNFTGIPDNTDAVPSVTLLQDEDDNYIIHYTIFHDATEVSNAGYYSLESYPNTIGSIATPDTYKQNAEEAFSYIMQGNFGSYSVLFQDVAKISFQEPESSSTGEITIGQLSGSGFPNSPGTSVFTYIYDPNKTNASSVYGDIWINTEHDTLPGVPGGYNVWDVNSTIVPGTAAFKILLEEVSHALGIDIYLPGTTVARDAALEPDSEVYVDGTRFVSVNRLSMRLIMASLTKPSAMTARAS
jgi:hypothetical protein